MENKELSVKAKFIDNKEYRCLLTEISGIVIYGRNGALRQIDTAQVITYWIIGKRIVDFFQKGGHRAVYGEQLLRKLSVDLTAKYGRGFSERNLEMMRMFYLEYPISQTLSAKSASGSPHILLMKLKLSWSHYCELLKEDNLKTRAFYEIEATKNGWSMRELRWQMNSLLHERLSLRRLYLCRPAETYYYDQSSLFYRSCAV